jgi:hypothetical protein
MKTPTFLNLKCVFGGFWNPKKFFDFQIKNYIFEYGIAGVTLMNFSPSP